MCQVVKINIKYGSEEEKKLSKKSVAAGGSAVEEMWAICLCYGHRVD